MRLCKSCKKPDSPRLDFDASCKGKCDPRATEDPATHDDACPRMTHEVVLYHKLLKPIDLVRTEAAPEGELRHKDVVAGWTLRRDGRDTFKIKLLCRGCIAVDVERDTNHKAYLKQCAALLGKEDKSYSEMLAAQTGF
jgi:hypothetical protein